MSVIGIRIVVTGGRDYANSELVDAVLSNLEPNAVAQGGASGADELARDWCAAHNVAVETFAAEWQSDGRAAGPIRNRKMLERFMPSIVVAFPGGRGTDDCVRQARRRGIVVLRVEP